jgi:hypothetical protein
MSAVDDIQQDTHHDIESVGVTVPSSPPAGSSNTLAQTTNNSSSFSSSSVSFNDDASAGDTSHYATKADGSTVPSSTALMSAPSGVSRDSEGRVIYACSVHTSRDRRAPSTLKKCHRTHLLCCGVLSKYYIGNMPVLCERNGEPLCIMGAWWWFCSSITLPLVLGSVILVTATLVIPYAPLWLYFVYYPFAITALGGLIGVSCTNPGLIPLKTTLTAEEKESNSFIWNDKVKSWRPRGAIYCSTNDVVVDKYDHFCPWTGTSIGGGNMKFFKVFVVAVNSLCYITVFVVVYLSVFVVAAKDEE